MPYVAGTFVRIHNWQDDRDNGIDILADRHDEEDDNLAAGLSLALPRDGSVAPTQNLPMGGKRHTGAGAAVDPNDYVIKQQFDDALSPGVSNIGDYLTTERVPGASWLKRNGAIVNQTDYPDLFALIGQRYARVSSFVASGAGLTGILGDVAYGGGVYVTVGEVGVIYRGTSGSVWASQTSGITTALAGVAYGAGLFVAVGASGVIRTSPDGVTWTGRTSGTANYIANVRYLNGMFIATAFGGVILVSTDGLSWSPRTSGVATDLKSAAYGNGIYVIVGNAGVTLYSTDANTWTKVNSGTAVDLRDVAYGNGIFVVVTNAAAFTMTSRTGSGWKQQTGAFQFLKVAFGSGSFVAMDSDGILSTSFDGESWAATGPAAGTLNGIGYTPVGFIAVGASGLVVRSVYGVNTVTQFQLPSDSPDIGYIKAL